MLVSRKSFDYAEHHGQNEGCSWEAGELVLVGYVVEGEVGCGVVGWPMVALIRGYHDEAVESSNCAVLYHVRNGIFDYDQFIDLTFYINTESLRCFIPIHVLQMALTPHSSQRTILTRLRLPSFPV